jgi:LmbE family N-acetylglucosaminyl deacetylase
MENTILETIIKRKKPVFFVSPHFDDAVFSAGALMQYLSKHIEVVVLTVFTKAGKMPYTLSAKTYLQQCGYTDAEQLYRDRTKEDAEALKTITGKSINLGFVEALWRKKPKASIFSKIFSQIPEFSVLYPTYRWHIISGNIAKEDFQTISVIKKHLEDQIKPIDSFVFCPVGIGSHIDHLVTRKACVGFDNLIYWADFPYNTKTQQSMSEFSSFIFDRELENKQKLAEKYQTQYKAMFKDGFPLQPEQFFLKKEKIYG